MAKPVELSEILSNPAYSIYVNPFDAYFFVLDKKIVDELYQKIMLIEPGDTEKYKEDFDRALAGYRDIIEKYRDLRLAYKEIIKEHLNQTEDSPQGDRAFKADEVVKNAIRAREEDKEKMRQMGPQMVQKVENELYKISSDAYVTAAQDKLMRGVLAKNKKGVVADNFILTQGMMATKYLDWIKRCKDGTLKERHEFCFSNGEIVIVKPTGLETNNPVSSLESIEEKLIRTILVANKTLQSDKRIKNKPISISGRYLERGSDHQYQTEPVRFSSTQLKEAAKSITLLSFISPEMYKRLAADGLIRKELILKAIEKGSLNPNVAIDYYRAEIITEKELLDTLKLKDFKALAADKRINLKGKFYLYALSKIKMDDLKKYVKENPDEEKPGVEFLSELVPHFSINIKKLGEFLTSDVLDYDVAVGFIDELEDQSAIRTETKPFLMDLLNDFRFDELDNISTSELMVGDGRTKYQPKKKGLTIDPDLRMGYLKSIGNVKQILIKGNPLMKDEGPENVKKNNSLDGYQLIIIPDKKVAVLEKFFETTRDKEGNVIYRRDKEGNRIPAIENATYIIPIGMAKEFSTKKNKKELIESPYVHRVFHKANWVGELEAKIQLVNEKAEFEVENTEKWAELVRNNYEELFENR